MDPLTHTLSGIVLANAGIRQRLGAGALLALVIASNLVDIDIFGLLFFDEPTWTYRRMWTHSVVTAPVLALIAASVFRWRFRQASFRSWVFVFLVGVLLHIFMDLINSYGVVLFFPFTRARFELAWVFIIDLYIWGILFLALAVPLVFRRKVSVEVVSKTAICFLVAYIASCGALRTYSLSLLEQYAEQMQPQYSFSYVFPEPFGPWKFHGVLRSGDEYSSYLVSPLLGTVEKKRTYHTDERDPKIARLLDSESGKRYSWFFKAPVWEKRGKDEVLVSDIRFKSLLLDRKAPFAYRVR